MLINGLNYQPSLLEKKVEEDAIFLSYKKWHLLWPFCVGRTTDTDEGWITQKHTIVSDLNQQTSITKCSTVNF
jgi:hypothetical protein